MGRRCRNCSDAGPRSARDVSGGSPGNCAGCDVRHTAALLFECPAHAASSMARMAVSGWLIGSIPTRLTMPVTVPSASASTHAAR